MNLTVASIVPVLFTLVRISWLDQGDRNAFDTEI